MIEFQNAAERRAIPQWKYYRRDGTPFMGPEPHLEWAMSFEHENRIVQQTRLWNRLVVSTVFLGLNHNWDPNSPPLIFETTVFPNGWHTDYYQERHTTEAQAIAGHRAALRRFRWWPFIGIPQAIVRIWSAFTPGTTPNTSRPRGGRFASSLWWR